MGGKANCLCLRGIWETPKPRYREETKPVVKVAWGHLHALPPRWDATYPITPWSLGLEDTDLGWWRTSYRRTVMTPASPTTRKVPWPSCSPSIDAPDAEGLTVSDSRPEATTTWISPGSGYGVGVSPP